MAKETPPGNSEAEEENSEEESRADLKQEQAAEEAAKISSLKKQAVAFKAAGRAQELAGKGVEITAQAPISVGRALIQFGLSLAATIIGVILTIVLVPAGAVIMLWGFFQKGAGKMGQISGKATKAVGRKKELEARALETKRAVSSSAATDQKFLFSPLGIFNSLIKTETGPAGFFKSLLPADDKEMMSCCFIFALGQLLGLSLLIIIVGGTITYVCTLGNNTFDICNLVPIQAIISLLSHFF